MWCDAPTNIVFQWKCLQHLNQLCFSTKHGSLAIFDLTDWQDFTSNDSNTIHRRLKKDHWSHSRKADKDKNRNFMRWMTDVKQPALQRHLAGVTPRSNVLPYSTPKKKILLRCVDFCFYFLQTYCACAKFEVRLWSVYDKFFCCLIRKIFHSDEEWHLFYCNNILRCRVIRGFVSCELDDLWHHKWTKKWSKNNETWNICVNTESTGLKYCKNYTLW